MSEKDVEMEPIAKKGVAKKYVAVGKDFIRFQCNIKFNFHPYAFYCTMATTEMWSEIFDILVY